MHPAIKTRISRRTYDPTPLSQQTIDAILAHIAELNTASGLSFVFVEDATAAFLNSVEKGLFIGARSLIRLNGPVSDSHLSEKVGYYGEELVLRLAEMGLSTCWLNSTFDRSVFSDAPGERMVCGLSVGTSPEATPLEKKVRDRLMQLNKPLSERITCDGEMPDWVVAGMEAVLLAPSSKNTQKVHFKLQDGVLTAHIIDDFAMDLVDLGIAKLHFEKEAIGKFDLGNGAQFHKD